MATARSKTARVQRKRKKSKTAPVMASLVIALELVAIGLALAYMQMQTAAIESDLQRTAAAHETKAQAARERILEQQRSISQDIKSIHAEKARLRRETSHLSTTIRELETVLGDIQQQNAHIERQLERIELDKSLVGVGLGELKSRADGLLQKRQALLDEFRERYTALKTDLRQRVDSGRADRVRAFYLANKDTPLGPAAAFMAGDLYYSKRQTRSARDMYERVIEEFPDSKYANIAQERIGDIKQRLSYNPYYTSGFYPYNMPESLDSGKW